MFRKLYSALIKQELKYKKITKILPVFIGGIFYINACRFSSIIMKKYILSSFFFLINLFAFTNCGGDEPSIKKIDFALDASSILEGGNVTVAFNTPLPSGVTPTISLTGTATENTDYTYSVTSAGLVFTTIDDGLYDPNETIIITLTGFNKGAEVGPKVVHTITITETPIVIEFQSQAATRIEGQSLVMSFNSELPDGVVPAFTVTGTATQVADFTYVQNKNGFVVTTKKDELYDPNETVIIELTGISGNAVLGTKKISTLTISDEDETALQSGLKIDLSWEALDLSVSDVDMDLLVWLETSPGVYTSQGGLWSANIGTMFETTTIPISEVNGKYAISYVYYSGTSADLKVKVDFRSFKGNINGTSNRASYIKTYTLVNINSYLDPYTQPDVVAQTFEKVSNNFINLSDIHVASSGSRTRSVTFILDDEARRIIAEKTKLRSGGK
jgi:hypothetical protein